jgi:hypothetical protein
VKLEKNTNDTWAILFQSYGGEDRKSQDFWHKRFKEGREKAENYERSGHSNLTEPMKVLKSAGFAAFR